MRARAAPAWVAAGLLTACRLGPAYQAPTLPEGSDGPLQSVAAGVETAAPPPDAWWRLYEDPRLDALVEEALAANRSLAAAEANFAAARAALSAVHAGRYPVTTASAQGAYGRDAPTDEILELTGRPPQTFWVFEDIFKSAYELDLFGRVHRAIEAADADADSARAVRDGVRVAVAAETARGYADVCALGEELDVARHSLAIVTREAEIAQNRYAAGAGALFDVTRAQALVAQAGAAIPTLEGRRRAALFALTAALGRTPARAPADLEACVTVPRLIALMPVGDGVSLIKRRPDVRQAERQLAAATAQIGVATADLYPAIRLIGFYGGAATALSDLNTNVGRTWGVGPSISWTFPNMAGPRARVRQTTARQAAALASFDSVVLTALEQAEQSLSIYAAALANREALAEARDRTREAFRMSHDEFDAGAVSTLDLLTTEQSVVALESAVASADAALIEDQIGVFKALGGGWRGEAR